MRRQRPNAEPFLSHVLAVVDRKFMGANVDTTVFRERREQEIRADRQEYRSLQPRTRQDQSMGLLSTFAAPRHSKGRRSSLADCAICEVDPAVPTVFPDCRSANHDPPIATARTAAAA